MAKTLGEIVRLSYDFMQSKNAKVGRHELEECIAGTLGFKRLDIYLNFDKPLNEDELSRIREKVKRLASNEPLQYIEGEVSFYACKIRVDKRVLIPRPETELLVDKIVKTLKVQDLHTRVLWDICTGSGCIGIAIKKALPALDVSLSDISKESLELARENANANDAQVSIVQGDLFLPFQGKMADFIVCNPPYVSKKEYEMLDPHVKDFEPELALVGGESGLEYYERLARDAKRFMVPSGLGFLEIGAGQGNSVIKIFSSYSNVSCIKDLAGLDRFVQFQIPS